MILVASATPIENALVREMLENPCAMKIGMLDGVMGYFASIPVIVFTTGVGKVNVTYATTLLLEYFRPSLFLLIGCGGAYRTSGLASRDLAIATKEIFGDEGVITPRGWRSMAYLNLPFLTVNGRKFYNEIPLDQAIVRRARKILKKYRPRSGPFVTVSEVTGTLKKANEMERRFHGICENMEGAAAAAVCMIKGIPFLEMRGISNIVKRRNPKEWDVAGAARVSQMAAIEIIARWRSHP